VTKALPVSRDEGEVVVSAEMTELGTLRSERSLRLQLATRFVLRRS
jgi:hypothetical protein